MENEIYLKNHILKVCVIFVLAEVHVRFYIHFSVVRIFPQISKFVVGGWVTCASAYSTQGW